MATRSSSAGKNGALDPALPQKKRARRRLVGALAVCLVAAIVLPIVLDSEPRQSREDVQVRIPSREAPLRNGDDGAVQGVIGGSRPDGAVAGRPDDATAGEVPPDPEAHPEGVAQAPGDAPPEAGQAAAPKSPAKSASVASAGAAVSGTASASTRAPSGATASGAPPSLAVPADSPAAQTRPEARAEARAADARGGFLLQAGAFASEKGALDQLARVRKAGVKAYTEKVSTSQGERIRVRIGPYPTREAAEKARAALKAAGVESALIAP